MENTITDHQTVLMELWYVFDSICARNHIKYQLYAGSALGAVRHHGIIPWDDDLDVVMLREDYNRFMDIAESELDKNQYFLQREFTEHWPMFFSKLRKNNTACIERYIPKDWETHMGIYIDIFPCDNLSDNPIKRKAQFAASKIVIAKSLHARGYSTDDPFKKLFIGVCKFLPKNMFIKIAINAKETHTEYVHTFFGAARRYQKNVFPRIWLEESIIFPFGGSIAPVSVHYDELLTKLYGDYMTPLPESQRGCKIHAEIVDTEHSYEIYQNVQRTMKFSEYTRSIR